MKDISCNMQANSCTSAHIYICKKKKKPNCSFFSSSETVATEGAVAAGATDQDNVRPARLGTGYIRTRERRATRLSVFRNGRTKRHLVPLRKSQKRVCTSLSHNVGARTCRYVCNFILIPPAGNLHFRQPREPRVGHYRRHTAVKDYPKW